jgi:7-keto-8-aminopelargonate synthetase-like enzyme
LVREADERRSTLAAHSSALRARLPALGFQVPPGDSPIVPVLLGEPRRALAVSAALYEAGFLAQAIRPPTVPQGTSRIRLVPMATHATADVDGLIGAFAALAPEAPCASS